MSIIGKYNTLTILREAEQGLYLDGGKEHGDILLPRRYISNDMKPGGEAEVFIYLDSEERLIATTEQPLAQVGDFACLQVVSINEKIGAFLNWGLSKDLLLPFREQANPLNPGDRVVVYIEVDQKSERIIATTRYSRHLSKELPPYQEGDKVNILIAGMTPLGYNAIVENAYGGLLYHSDITTPLPSGKTMTGYVRAIRPDNKIDLGLDQAGYKTRIAPLTETIIEALKANGGNMEFNDKSSPEKIRETFNVSKKAFKQALGALYKKKRIKFTATGIKIP
ncbi:MAG: GntR family transcriptional regulator [Kiritimatiellae bacterium]|nr:GntR family transcriptional regulator [Kiritimatiellia bacterium]